MFSMVLRLTTALVQSKCAILVLQRLKWHGKFTAVDSMHLFKSMQPGGLHRLWCILFNKALNQKLFTGVLGLIIGSIYVYPYRAEQFTLTIIFR